MRKFRARVGCYEYTVEVHPDHLSENHGDTDRELKAINLFDNGNAEVTRETFLHELLHAMMEDLFTSIQDIEKIDDKEELFIRLFSPRMMQFAQDNPAIMDYLFFNGEMPPGEVE